MDMAGFLNQRKRREQALDIRLNALHELRNKLWEDV